MTKYAVYRLFQAVELIALVSLLVFGPMLSYAAWWLLRAYYKMIRDADNP